MSPKKKSKFRLEHSNLYCLSFIVTHRCNLKCRMCIDNCSPLRTEPPISIHLVEKVLEEVRQLHVNLIHGVVITGGETSLYPDLCCDIVSLVNDYGHRCILVTNAQFGTSFEDASAFLGRLKDSGLNWLGVSWDEEHTRAKMPIRIVNTLAAAHNLCFDAVYLSSVTERDNTAAFHDIIDTIWEKYNIKINHADQGRLHEQRARSG